MKKKLLQCLLLAGASFVLSCNPSGATTEKKEAENTQSGTMSAVSNDSTPENDKSQPVTTSGSSDDQVLESIRKRYDAINAMTFKTEKHTIDCGDVTYYIANGDIKKIKKNWFAGDYGGDEEYFFEKGQLFFAYFWDEGGAANQKVTRQECRYYFSDGKLISQLSKGKRTCTTSAKVMEMANDCLNANKKKDYTTLGCF